MKTVTPRTHHDQEPPEVFRTPRKISDAAYEGFNSSAHRQKLAEGTAIYANRMIREESFTIDELLEIKAIMTDGVPETQISAECLGGKPTLRWIESILNGRN